MLVKISAGEEVSDRNCRCWKQPHIAEDAAHVEAVLIFQPTPVGPAEHAHRDRVLTVAQVSRQIELGRQLAVLPVANKFAVYPELERGFDPIEVDKHLLASPCGIKHKGPLVASGRIAVGRLDARERV